MICLADRRTVRGGGRRWTIPIPFSYWDLFMMRPHCLISWAPLDPPGHDPDRELMS
jgi:hypothetical protein